MCSTDDALKDQVNLDAILTVVDAKHCLQHIRQEAKGKAVNEVCNSHFDLC